MNNLLEFHGPNAGYALELYDRYLQDPQSVDAETRAVFESGIVPPSAPPPPPAFGAKVAPVPAPATAAADAGPPSDVVLNKAVAAARLARIIRELGHLNARLDPLGSDPPGDPSLELATHNLTVADLEALPASVIGGPSAQGAKNAAEAMERLRRVYSGSIGYEDDHIQVAEERAWLREAVESERFFKGVTANDKRAVLMRLTEVDTFEQFLQNTQPFQGQKRFSIEGSDVMVPVLDTIIRCAAESGTCEVVMGMAHRGRLNVLSHVLGKPYDQMLAEFHNPNSPEEKPAVAGTGSLGYSGDVKYHKGYRRSYTNNGECEMPITLAPNPSHLEFVNPAVVGRARAAQEKRDKQGGPEQDIKASLAILIHGDAAFPGQGIVAETLNLSQLKGYTVGGTIHIIANNQVGFTTDPSDSRSTLYASDLAKGFEIPILHVNGDDPLACLAAARMACAYHQKFGKDFLIDLIGYRRLGHNETDEPRFTQPLLYAKVDRHPRPREVWAAQLEKEGVVTRAEADAMVQEVRDRLMAARQTALAVPTPAPSSPAHEASSDGGMVPDEPASRAEAAAVPAETLRELNASLYSFPEGFQPSSKLVRLFVEPRRGALEDPETRRVEWAHAESLAFASLLTEGTPIRLTGQDSERGTFTQRHLVFHDTETGNAYTPLQNLPQAKATFAVYNSPLSEQATVGFEYGYSIHATETLVLWEAQFGDFVNGAQVILDQFVVSGNAKWQQTPSLVLLLPHGYEGQGPEHSSGRVERFLQSCAGDNMIVANCTTAAQYYHLLRRQGAQLQSNPRPLIVMTPKSLLRHPRAASSLRELTEGTFQSVIDDVRATPERNAGVTRLLLCSGKVYVDLVYGPAPKFEERAEYASSDRVAVGRVEELYPFPTDAITALLASYPALREVAWVQEEPQNMGAWTFVAPRLSALLPEGVTLRYEGRAEAASPAEGKISAHEREQNRLVRSSYADALAPQPVGGAYTNGAAPATGRNGGGSDVRAARATKSKTTQREVTTHAD
ncbi:MAG TPA: 2-oxoglutarate dehydrogenase E1 component [Armatimonadaceae bacterium]|nr:2-oxoglutarate dehydrogenase E1 component [Armatimonadaceae bacterium]